MVVAIAAVIAAAVLYFGAHRMQTQPPPRPTTPAREWAHGQPPPQGELVPSIRYPIVPGQSQAQARDGEAALWDAVIGLIGDRSLQTLLNRQNFVQRVVATVDNLPRKKVPLRQMPVKPMHENIAVIGQGDYASLSPANYARYERYVRLMQSVDTSHLVAVYVRYYSLFQQAFRNLGYPNGYFNDRVVEAIDDLLATPDLPDPPSLDRPKVLYVFEDPELEALSAGQKIMIRIGPLNAAKAKAKLREIRRERVSQARQ
jgi:hypothetical protein